MQLHSRLTLALAIGALTMAGCYTHPIGPGNGDAGTAPDACVDTQLCVIGYHFDSQACRCVPDADAGVGVPCGATTCAPGQICCSPSCGICGAKAGLCPAIACIPDGGAGVPCGNTTCGPGQKCCSPSCGICGPLHGLCPAIACAPSP